MADLKASPHGKKSFTFAVHTMGCKANLTDSQSLEARLRDMGGSAVEEGKADVLVLNTCTVTDNADKEALSLIRRSKAPLTVAAGCMAEVSPDKFKKEEGSLVVVRNSAKDSISSAVEEWLSGMFTEQSRLLQGDRTAWHGKIDYVPGASALSGGEEEAVGAHRTRAFLKVQDGCNAFCSYCIIPHARGRSRSLEPEKVAEEIRLLLKNGIQEIVLTAIHAADYEWNGVDFTGLVEYVLEKTPIQRLRLTSLDPAEIPERLIALMEKNGRLCPHFHISLQSANSRVLAAMKRGYGAEQVEECLLKIEKRLPHAFVGMDVIAGFPGETEEEFEDSFERLRRLPWTRLHVFPFSVRKSTAAARLVEEGYAVPQDRITLRARRLRELSDEKLHGSMVRKIGSVQEILIEAKPYAFNGRVCSQGHTRSYHKVLVPGRHAVNTLRRVKIIGLAEKDYLKGEFV